MMLFNCGRVRFHISSGLEWKAMLIEISFSVVVEDGRLVHIAK